MLHFMHKKVIQEASELATKPLAERERALWAASDSYMSGKISLQDLKAVEQPYLALEYAKSVGAFGTESPPSSFLGSVVRLFKLP